MEEETFLRWTMFALTEEERYKVVIMMIDARQSSGSSRCLTLNVNNDFGDITRLKMDSAQSLSHVDRHWFFTMEPCLS